MSNQDKIYYNKDLNIDGTADQLFKEVRNGYRTKEEEIDKIADILASEGKTDAFLYCLYENEAMHHEDRICNFARLKQRYLEDKVNNSENRYPRLYGHVDGFWCSR